MLIPVLEEAGGGSVELDESAGAFLLFAPAGAGWCLSFTAPLPDARDPLLLEAPLSLAFLPLPPFGLDAAFPAALSGEAPVPSLLGVFAVAPVLPARALGLVERDCVLALAAPEPDGPPLP